MPQRNRCAALRESAVRCVQQLLAHPASHGALGAVDMWAQHACQQRGVVTAPPSRPMPRWPALRVLVAALCCIALATPCALVDAAPAQVRATIVTNAAGLKDALEGDAVHVRITKHLDLRGLPGLDELAPYYALFHPNSTLQSITVRADFWPAVYGTK